MWTIIEAFIGLTWWLSDKESACNAGDLGMIPGLGRYPGGENGYPLQYTCLENSMDSGAWWATVYGVVKSQIGEGNGTPLQSSCLEKCHGWRSLVGCSPWGR